MVGYHHNNKQNCLRVASIPIFYVFSQFSICVIAPAILLMIPPMSRLNRHIFINQNFGLVISDGKLPCEGNLYITDCTSCPFFIYVLKAFRMSETIIFDYFEYC